MIMVCDFFSKYLVILKILFKIKTLTFISEPVPFRHTVSSRHLRGQGVTAIDDLCFSAEKFGLSASSPTVVAAASRTFFAPTKALLICSA